jgi:hypothetical protein
LMHWNDHDIQHVHCLITILGGYIGCMPVVWAVVYQLFWKAVTFIVANISTSTHILLLCMSNCICQS